MGVKLLKCILCQSKKISIFCESSIYKFIMCNKCELLYLKNDKSLKNYTDVYYDYTTNHRYQKTDSKNRNPALNFFLRSGWSEMFLNLQSTNIFVDRANFVKQLAHRKQSVLDVGCGAGQFLKLLKKDERLVTGIEMDKLLVKYAKESIGKNNIIRGDFLKLKIKNKFDVVTFWHVFEHIQDFNKTLSKTHGILNRKGIVVIEVPSSSSLNMKIFRSNWTMLVPPLHFHFWSKKTLDTLLKKSGFKLQKVSYPGYFPFIFATSFIKKNNIMLFFAPILLLISVLVSFFSAFVNSGDVIRIYATKK